MRFAETVKLTGIKSTPDFRVEQGGSCVEGNVYQDKSTCTLLVRFTPTGAGRRIGRIKISHTGFGSPTPMVVSGFSSQPVVSFVPALITTLPGSYPASKGLLSGAQNLTFDGGDTLYVADSANNTVRMYDGSNTFTTLATTNGNPWGVAADSYGQVWFSIPSANVIDEIYDYGEVVQGSGSGTDACTFSTTPCSLGLETTYGPGSISIDPSDTMIFEDDSNGAAKSQLQPSGATLLRLYDPFSYPATTPVAFGVDADQTLYTAYTSQGACQINTQSLSSAEQFLNAYSKVAGGRICGFAGDGGMANNAEISASIGQIAFDQANDLYFTDTGNQRVRRVEKNTHIIRTIAGTGTAGYTGDGGSGLAAELKAPTGVAVDSKGAVYIISSAATGQVIRKLGPNGILNFGKQGKGIPGIVHISTLTNTGNSPLVLTSYSITGPNASDFKLDTSTTTCLLATGTQFAVGQTCQIGVIFTPSVAATRTANLTLLDNSVTGINTIQLFGTGVKPSPTFVITSPANGSSFTSGTAVTFSAKVTSTLSPAPTGTVQFKVDGANFGGPVTLSSGVASTSVTGLTQKAHTFGAIYSGDTVYAAAGPITVSVTVTAVKIGSFISLAPTVNAADSCTAPAFSVDVSAQSGQSIPTGEVRLLDSGALLASGTLASGKVTLIAKQLGMGSHTLTAQYAGDALHLASTSSAFVENVGPTRPCTGPISGSGARALQF